MPTGIPNKKKKVVVEAPIQTQANVTQTEEKHHGKESEKEKEVQKSAVLTKPVLEPLQPGQQYFEAPDGEILIGESDRPQMWYRKLNNGKGGWINPKR